MITNAQLFYSSLTNQMVQFVNYKRIQGYDYTDQAEALCYFDRFLHKHNYSQKYLTKDIIDEYIAETARLMANGQRRRLTIVRLFSRYLQTLHPESYVLHEAPLQYRTTPRYYLYSNEDISALLQCAQELTPYNSIRPHCFTPS